jgi:uncharacterized protein with NRDE domain
MCLLLVCSRTDPTVPLIVAANRDERLDRPAVVATVLASSGPRIIGGRDLKAGGTWLAVNEHGLVTGLTNRPSPNGRDDSKRSRGELPLALAAHRDAAGAVDEFVQRFRPSDFNSAWLLVGDRRSLYYIELGDDAAPAVEELGAGVYVLANGPLHGSAPKTDYVRDRVRALPQMAEPDVLATMRSVLADHTIPGEVAATPAEKDRPKELAAACVHTEDYGTRSAALVRVPATGLPSMWVSDGPPCRTAFISADSLWSDDRSLDPGTQS